MLFGLLSDRIGLLKKVLGVLGTHSESINVKGGFRVIEGERRSTGFHVSCQVQVRVC